jgi:peroxiredoxin
MKYCFLTLILVTLNTGIIIGQVPAQIIPDFEFSKLDHSPFTNRDLPQDKMLFFVFFDADCEHCQHAMKNIDARYLSFKKTKIFLISLDDNAKIKHFVNTFAPHLKDQKNVLLLRDNLNQFITKFKPYKYPSMFLYSAERKLIDYEDNEETVFRFVNTINKAIK